MTNDETTTVPRGGMSKKCGYPVDIVYGDETGGDIFTRPCDKKPHATGAHMVDMFEFAGGKLAAVQHPGQEFATLYTVNIKEKTCIHNANPERIS